MNDFFSQFTNAGTFGRVALQPIFDAERETPDLVDSVASEMPQIRQIMASLRQSLPLVPHSGIGPLGNGEFCRIPNHYRSVSFLVPSQQDAGSPAGAIVFKGTEPLIADFPAYLDWMLATPFRESMLPLGLHFPLDLKLPPAAMWIKECIMEQSISSEVHQRHLRSYGHLARLPLPLFVYALTPQQMEEYEDVVRPRVSADAFKKIGPKLADGLGIEVYYYPSLPVRAADIQMGAGKEALASVLTVDGLESIFEEWIGLLSKMLYLGYMPYAPWHHGMGSCVDPGNACIDGGFNDLLTLVPFGAIPSETLFRRSLLASIQSLADSVLVVCAAASDSPSNTNRDPLSLAFFYVLEGLRERVRAGDCASHDVDMRLMRFFDAPTVGALLQDARWTHQDRKLRGTQFTHGEAGNAPLIDPAAEAPREDGQQPAMAKQA